MTRLLAIAFAACVAATGGCALDMGKDEQMKKDEMMKKDDMMKK